MRIVLSTLLSLLFILPGFATDENMSYKRDKKTSLRILSYNVQHCAGQDGKVDYDRISKIINDMDADVVCLQEIDSLNGRTPDDQMLILAAKTNMKGYFSKSIDFMNGKYGNGILTRKEPLKVHRISLPGEEPRSAIAVEFKKYVVIGTHLDLTPENREASILLLTDFAKQFKKKVYLAGDFNEFDTTTTFFKEMLIRWDWVSTDKASYPTGKPVECLDMVFVLKDFKYQLQKTNVVYALPGVNVSMASDHYPVYSDFK